MANKVIILPLLFTVTLLAFGCRSSASHSLENIASEKRKSPMPTVSFTPQIDEKSDAKVVDLKNTLVGTWKQENVQDCYCNPCLNIQFEKDDDFCVQFFQATVSAFYKLDEKNKKIYIHFKEPTDLGRGGLGLEWKKFDRRKPIAVIDISKAKSNEISLKWLGFTYKKTNRRVSDYGSQYEGVYKKDQ